MYLSEIILTNIRCFKEMTLEFETDKSPFLWSMILGDNSTGKSCLLRAIALGLCDEASAAALMKELPGDMIRVDKKSKKIIYPPHDKKRSVYKGSIEVKIRNPQTKAITNINTVIVKEKTDSPEIIYQTIKSDDNFSWDRIFLCGYGPHRAISADTSYNKYTSLEAVYTMFNYGAPLQNPELIYRRFEREDPAYADKLKNSLLEILMLQDKNYDIILNKRGMWLKTPEKEVVPLDTMSDGYKSTTNWFLDCLSWSSLAKRRRGILLIDEIEQHIHPSWQIALVSLIRKNFPQMQIISTTHSPLSASGIGTLKSKTRHERIIHIRKSKGHFYRNYIPNLKGLNFDQILASSAFDFYIQSDPEVEAFLKEASRLAEKGTYRTSSESRKYNQIVAELERIYQPTGKTLIERDLEKRRIGRMKKEIKELTAILGSK